MNLDELRVASAVADRADLATRTLCSLGVGRVRGIVIRTSGGDVEIPAELVPVVFGGVGHALRGERNYHMAVLRDQFKIEVAV